MASSTTVANVALVKLGGSLLTNLDSDNTPRSRKIKAIYDHFRDVELSKHYWNFAKEYKAIAADSTAPPFGYSYRHLKPADFLKVYRIRDNGNVLTRITEYKIVGDYILTDISGALYLEYVRIITDVNKFHPLFVEALACQIALQMCEDVTQSNSKKTILMKEYKEALAEAKKSDAIDEPPQEPVESDYITVRN